METGYDVDMAGFKSKKGLEDAHEYEGELECEDVIMNEKERFGRVRTSMMKILRKKHGKIADRALSRINKRLSQGSLKINYNLLPPNYRN